MSRADASIQADLRTSILDAPRPEEKPVVQTAVLDNGSTALFVVSRDDLIEMKLRAARPQDIADVQKLQELDR